MAYKMITGGADISDWDTANFQASLRYYDKLRIETQQQEGKQAMPYPSIYPDALPVLKNGYTLRWDTSLGRTRVLASNGTHEFVMESGFLTDEAPAFFRASSTAGTCRGEWFIEIEDAIASAERKMQGG